MRRYRCNDKTRFSFAGKTFSLAHGLAPPILMLI